MEQTFIVTGGAGFVGSNVVAALLGRSPRPRVVVIDPFRSGSFANVVEACERAGVGAFDGEVTPASTAEVAWGREVERVRPRAVFHLGAITDTTVSAEAEMIRENAGGFGSMLRACAGVGAPVVYASSAATYGTPGEAGRREAFAESSAGRPSNVYGFSKWLMEAEHRRHQAEHPGHLVVGLRYFNMFGAGEWRKGPMASMAFQLASRLLEGGRPRLFVDGTQARDQVPVGDVVECTIRAAGLEGVEGGARPRAGVYNLGSGVATTFNEVLAAVREGVGVGEREAPTEYFEMPGEVRAFYQDFTRADMRLAESGLGWRPRREVRPALVEYGRLLRAEWGRIRRGVARG